MFFEIIINDDHNERIFKIIMVGYGQKQKQLLHHYGIHIFVVVLSDTMREGIHVTDFIHANGKNLTLKRICSLFPLRKSYFIFV